MLIWLVPLALITVVTQENLGDLLTNPTVVALLGISAGGGGLLGWILKGVIAAAKTEAKTEMELAVEALERAKATPDPTDDIEAQKHVDFIRRIKALADALPDPPQS